MRPEGERKSPSTGRKDGSRITESGQKPAGQVPFGLAQGKPRPLLFILSGPSGVGKDAVLARMKASGFPLSYVITLTTRPKREKERAGVDYYFTSIEEFRRLRENNELLECANVYGNWYGVPKTAVRQELADGHDVMLKVDIQGVANIKEIVPQAVTIFLSPSSMEELEQRLRRRHTESEFGLARRLQIANEEMKQMTSFDYAVVNREGGIERAVADIEAIIIAENCRVNRRGAVL